MKWHFEIYPTLLMKCMLYLIIMLHFHFADIVEFSDEEGYGKFLDMHALHSQFLNVKHMEVCVWHTCQCCTSFL